MNLFVLEFICISLCVSVFFTMCVYVNLRIFANFCVYLWIFAYIYVYVLPLETRNSDIQPMLLFFYFKNTFRKFSYACRYLFVIFFNFAKFCVYFAFYFAFFAKIFALHVAFYISCVMDSMFLRFILFTDWEAGIQNCTEHVPIKTLSGISESEREWERVNLCFFAGINKK